jgi:xylulokinase
MFLSPVFRQTLANVAGVTIELYDADGAQGAARGAAVGARLFGSFGDAFKSLRKMEEVRPVSNAIDATQRAYDCWLSHVRRILDDAAR